MSNRHIHSMCNSVGSRDGCEFYYSQYSLHFPWSRFFGFAVGIAISAFKIDQKSVSIHFSSFKHTFVVHRSTTHIQRLRNHVFWFRGRFPSIVDHFVLLPQLRHIDALNDFQEMPVHKSTKKAIRKMFFTWFNRICMRASHNDRHHRITKYISNIVIDNLCLFATQSGMNEHSIKPIEFCIFNEMKARYATQNLICGVWFNGTDN